MTPGARTQAAIDLLAQILDSWQGAKRIPADKLLENYFKSHRYIGSKDRGAISELVYWCLRHKAALEWWLTAKFKSPIHARAVILTAVVLRRDYTVAELNDISQDSKYAIPRLTAAELERCEKLANEKIEQRNMPDPVRLNYPEWLDAKLRETFGKDFDAAMTALNDQAPLDLRTNTLKTTRDALMQYLRDEGLELQATETSPMGIRLFQRAPVFSLKVFKEGHFEVQDEGSQMAALLVAPEPGQKVIDFCAGAGGKTLAMAALMKNKGRILAWDKSEKRLGQLPVRLKRAGVDNVQTHAISGETDAFIKRHKQSADRVLVDAPCSGTGTWRRNPDLKWRFSAQDLQEVTALQQSILQSAARLVKPGGRLIYVTCSVLKDENERQIDQFLKSVNDFRVVCAEKVWNKTVSENDAGKVSYLSVTPHQDGVDGFFGAVLERLPG